MFNQQKCTGTISDLHHQIKFSNICSINILVVFILYGSLNIKVRALSA